MPKADRPDQPHTSTSLLSEPRQPETVRAVTVSGTDWATFLTKAVAVSRGEDTDPAWLKRAPSYARKWDRERPIYFRADEQPLCRLQNDLDLALVRGKTLLVSPDAPGSVLELGRSIISDESFHLGSGLSEYGPPMELIFLWRDKALMVFVAALLMYVGIPWRRFAAGELHYSRWRVCLGDFGGALLLTGFFVLPMLIVGGSMQAFAVYGVFPAVLWPLAGLGGVVIIYGAWTASFSLRINEAGFKVKGMADRIDIPFSFVTKVSPAQLLVPRWLVKLLWIAALLGKGTSSLRAMGQAMIMEGAQSTGFALSLKDGNTAYIWLTDAAGTMALPGGNTVEETMRRAGLTITGETLSVVRLLPPAVIESGKRRFPWLAWVVALLIFFGPALLVFLVAR